MNNRTEQADAFDALIAAMAESDPAAFRAAQDLVSAITPASHVHHE